jgi:hypothetical protein
MSYFNQNQKQNQKGPPSKSAGDLKHGTTEIGRDGTTMYEVRPSPNGLHKWYVLKKSAGLKPKGTPYTSWNNKANWNNSTGNQNNGWNQKFNNTKRLQQLPVITPTTGKHSMKLENVQITNTNNNGKV